MYCQKLINLHNKGYDIQDMSNTEHHIKINTNYKQEASRAHYCETTHLLLDFVHPLILDQNTVHQNLHIGVCFRCCLFRALTFARFLNAATMVGCGWYFSAIGVWHMLMLDIWPWYSR
ncbi:hypothetical protein Anas_12042 [Armadillidium nasatum]|uniref:Uncharacterized protein n=1 Tax=Armadillidium nasatum TaxID=96803 RepID=A0A5N5T3L1_9CRUS|nr:hypothetical protein Anas_12042 [Armadillidium nasatum]